MIKSVTSVSAAAAALSILPIAAAVCPPDESPCDATQRVEIVAPNVVTLENLGSLQQLKDHLHTLLQGHASGGNGPHAIRLAPHAGGPHAAGQNMMFGTTGGPHAIRLAPHTGGPHAIGQNMFFGNKGGPQVMFGGGDNCTISGRIEIRLPGGEVKVIELGEKSHQGHAPVRVQPHMESHGQMVFITPDGKQVIDFDGTNMPDFDFDFELPKGAHDFFLKQGGPGGVHVQPGTHSFQWKGSKDAMKHLKGAMKGFNVELKQDRNGQPHGQIVIITPDGKQVIDLDGTSPHNIKLPKGAMKMFGPGHSKGKGNVQFFGTNGGKDGVVEIDVDGQGGTYQLWVQDGDDNNATAEVVDVLPLHEAKSDRKDARTTKRIERIRKQLEKLEAMLNELKAQLDED